MSPKLTATPPQLKAAATTTPIGSGVAADSAKGPRGFREIWYGFYPNGREVLLGVERVRGDNLTAIYAVGPSVDDAYPSAWSRRQGRIVHDDFVFDEKGKSTLRFRPCQDGGLEASWIAADGKTSLSAHLKLIDPEVLADRRRGNAPGNAPRDASMTRSAPVAAAAAHGNGNEAEN